MTATATARTMRACAGWCVTTPATRVASRAPVAAWERAGGHETRVARCLVRFESGRCRTGRGGDAGGRVRARASRAWTVVAGASERDDGDATSDPESSASLGEGVSIRVADPVPEPPASAQVTPPRRRRGRPKGTRKVTNAPVPGDAMGVASLLWRLASDDEALNGRARIQPHGLEAVVPEAKRRVDASPSSEDETNDEDEDDDDDDDDDATVSGRKTSGADVMRDENERNGVSIEERRRRASRSVGVARGKSTRKKIAARQRERWAAARAEATAKQTADVARALAKRREDAIAAAKKAALEGGAAAADAAARDGVESPRSSAPKSPWETLAANAGGAPIKRAAERTANESEGENGDGDEALGVKTDLASFSESLGLPSSMATDAAERAAAFAALLSDASGGAAAADARSSSLGARPSPGAAPGTPANAPSGTLGTLSDVYRSFDASVDEDEDDELRATKRRMKEQLAKLTKRRAEMMGATGAPSAVTVAKFTNELARYKRLRADLEEWSNAFSEKYRRRPTLKDVERTGIAFLVENFKEYVELRDKLMGQTPHLRGQMEDVAKATLPTPRVVNKQSINAVASRGGGSDASGTQSAARRIAAAREGKYGAGVSAALGMEPAGPGSRVPLGPSAGGARGGAGWTSQRAAEISRASSRASSLAGKSGSASAEANLAMKRAAAYRDVNGAANAARRGRGRGREMK